MSIENAIRAWARGIYPSEAGVELLIRQGRAIYEGAPWLTALESLGADRPPMVAIDVDQLLAECGVWSGGEQRIVRIAASLLGGPEVDLSTAVSGLDREHQVLVLAAIAHAGGSHEHAGPYEPDPEGTVMVNGVRSRASTLPSLYPWPRPV